MQSPPHLFLPEIRRRSVGTAAQQPEEPEEGETAGVVKLISAEGFEFVVDKKAAMVSSTLRNMLTSPGGFSETREGEVRFPEISTPILEKICQYFYWPLHYSSGKETVEFATEPEITLELTMAANYLEELELLCSIYYFINEWEIIQSACRLLRSLVRGRYRAYTVRRDEVM